MRLHVLRGLTQPRVLRQRGLGGTHPRVLRLCRCCCLRSRWHVCLRLLGLRIVLAREIHPHYAVHQLVARHVAAGLNVHQEVAGNLDVVRLDACLQHQLKGAGRYLNLQFLELIQQAPRHHGPEARDVLRAAEDHLRLRVGPHGRHDARGALAERGPRLRRRRRLASCRQETPLRVEGVEGDKIHEALKVHLFLGRRDLHVLGDRARGVLGGRGAAPLLLALLAPLSSGEAILVALGVPLRVRRLLGHHREGRERLRRRGAGARERELAALEERLAAMASPLGHAAAARPEMAHQTGPEADQEEGAGQH
mmetsp:Transcript_78302/g.221433  ORF Transcript_78302/g.221433 Transcript_78302/m.221433 type:complete len:309 (-) Transcript_78302:163-1089(-)